MAGNDFCRVFHNILENVEKMVSVYITCQIPVAKCIVDSVSFLLNNRKETLWGVPKKIVKIYRLCIAQ